MHAVSANIKSLQHTEYTYLKSWAPSKYQDPEKRQSNFWRNFTKKMILAVQQYA